MTHRKQNDTKRRRFPLGSILSIIIVIAIAIGIGRLVANNPDTGSVRLPEKKSLDISAEQLMKVITNPALDTATLSYRAMEMSFNPTMHQPNWVAWELTSEKTDGTIKRNSQFYADESVPGCAQPYDYSYSGYDRGHMAPAGDMKWDADAMRETFCMTNICPQAKVLNSGAWKRLEEKCRTIARLDSALIIVCGPVLTDSISDHIGDTGVAVPRRFFKVVLSPYTTPIRAIGFIMDNDRVKGGMQAAAVSIDEVERITGHDFFSALPDSIENRLEATCDFNGWSNRR